MIIVAERTDLAQRLAPRANQKVLNSLCLLSTLLNNSLRLFQSYRKWDVNYSPDYGGGESHPSFVTPLPSPVPTKLSILFWDAETENLVMLKVKIDKVCWFKLKKTSQNLWLLAKAFRHETQTTRERPQTPKKCVKVSPLSLQCTPRYDAVP